MENLNLNVSINDVLASEMSFYDKTYQIFYAFYVGFQKINNISTKKHNEKIELFLLALKENNILNNLSKQEIKGKAMMLDLFNRGDLVEISISIFLEEFIDRIVNGNVLGNEFKNTIKDIAYKANRDFNQTSKK